MCVLEDDKVLGTAFSESHQFVSKHLSVNNKRVTRGMTTVSSFVSFYLTPLEFIIETDQITRMREQPAVSAPANDRLLYWCVCAGYWEEEHSYSRRNWERYQREVLHELGCRGEDDEEEDGNKYDSD